MCPAGQPGTFGCVAENYDVIIVGSGAGGGTLAHTLASSGQRILLRVGPDNERRLKAKLADLRHQLATGEVAKK